MFLVYRSAEDDPEKPLWVLPVRRTVGSQVCCDFQCCSILKLAGVNGVGDGFWWWRALSGFRCCVAILSGSVRVRY